MTSTQSSGLVLGYTPAWVICYAKPGRSREIAYYLDLYFGQRLNLIDFKVDRYVLDTEMSRNWDPVTQIWTPTPSLTTFDRVNTTGFTDIGTVNVCTELAFVEVNGRTVADINALGGLDGQTWVVKPGQSPPSGTRVIIRNGSLVIFVRQEFFPRQDSITAAFTDNIDTFDENEFDSGETSGTDGTYDYGRTVPGGSISTCTNTDAVTDFITCDSTLGMTSGDKVWFTGSVFGGIATSGVGGSTRLYYVRQVRELEATATLSATDEIVVASTADIANDDEIWFGAFTLGGISPSTVNGSIKPYYVINRSESPARFQIAETPGGAAVALTDDSASGQNMKVYLPAFQLSLTADLASAVPLESESGTMFANYRNLRLAVYRVTIGENETVNLTVETQTVANDYITSTQGRKYTTGTQLYHTPIPQLGLSRNSWAPLITASPVIATETTWDQGSVQWVEPVDMYDPGDEYDKYLVFPKIDILQ